MKNSNVKRDAMPAVEQLDAIERAQVTTVGIDVGDRSSQYAGVNAAGEVVCEGRVATRKGAIISLLGRFVCGIRVVIEVGMHSPWITRAVREQGFALIVANTRSLRLISGSTRKSDRRDARILATIGQSAPQLLDPVEHRSEQAQQDRAVLVARDAMVRARARLISQTRGIVKSVGGRFKRCSAEAFAARAAETMPATLRPALDPVVTEIERLTVQIRAYDLLVKQITSRYPGCAAVEAITGVGPITALAFVLAVGDPARFHASRRVGAYFGLVPRQHDSGDSAPQLRITKAGDRMVRRLLVGGAQYILGPFGPDSDLRRHGLMLAARGGKNAKRRAVVAVARKLAVLMHKLWISGAEYEPLFNAMKTQAAA
jgi:transposase